ncbi:MAG: hypothetical protein ACJ8FT_03835 [Sphingomonas sp.]
MIASHYAEAVACSVGVATPLRTAASDEAEVVRGLEPHEPFAMLDDSLGWAWGYAGAERRVGYVRSDALKN